MRGVAAWDRKPDPDALLAARVARGWMPTPSLLRDAAQVLGHACTLVSRLP